jgi:hypothetical protein
MTDGPTVDDIVVRYVPENVTSATEDHLYNEQLAVFNDDNPQTPSDFKIEQSRLSISVTYRKENANVFYFKLIDLLLFSAK